MFSFKKVFNKIYIGLLFFIIWEIIFTNDVILQTRSTATDSLIVDFVERRIGKVEISIIVKDRVVYLPFNEIFDYLRLKYEYNSEKKYLTGFIISTDSSFNIDFLERVGVYKDRIIQLREIDFILQRDKIYLNEKVFRNLYNWDIKYDDKKLEVVLKSKIQFPQLQQQQRQRRIQKKIEGQITEADLYLKRQPQIINLGKLNYNLNAYNFKKEDIRMRYNLSMGGQLFFGDFETSIRGITREKIKERNLRGFIRYPFFENKIINQITIGDIQKLSFVGGNFFGIDITNVPAERRYEFSKYIIKTKIPALSEYNLDGRLVSPYYTTTSKDTTISIPTTLYYGYSQYTEKIYDWYGRERMKERYIIIPTSMIPPGKLDYKLSAGILRHKNYPEYSSFELGYGATDYITLGTGIEYLNKKGLKGKFFPYTFTTLRLYDNIYGIAEFSPFVLGRANVMYQTVNGTMLNLRYSIHSKNKILNPRNIESSYGSGLFLPLRFKDINNLLNLNIDNNFLSNGQELFLRGGIGTYFKNINFVYNYFLSSLSSKFYFWELIQDEDTGEEILKEIERKISIKTIQSELTASLSATRFSNLNTGLRFDHVAKRIKSVNLGINLYLFSNLGVNLNFERDFINKQIYGLFNISFSPYYTSVSATALIGSIGNFYSTNLRGEMIGSTQTFDLLFNRYTQRNKGYFLGSAFLDLNNNGKRDKDEQYLEDASITTQRVFGFGIPFNRKYGRYNYLLAGELYRDYIFSVKTLSLDDPFLVPKYEGIKVKAEPNKLKRIEIPIVTGGIIVGSIIDENGNPIGGLNVILSKDDKVKRIVLTNSKGEFEFPTVPPGNYYVYIDEEVLKASNAFSEPPIQEIQITGEPEKGFVSTNFVVKFK